MTFGMSLFAERVTSSVHTGPEVPFVHRRRTTYSTTTTATSTSATDPVTAIAMHFVPHPVGAVLPTVTALVTDSALRSDDSVEYTVCRSVMLAFIH